jgi:hypothetical protein
VESRLVGLQRLAAMAALATLGCRGAVPASGGGDGDSAPNTTQDTGPGVPECGTAQAGPSAWWPGAGWLRVAVELSAPEGAVAGSPHALSVDLPALGIDDPGLLASARLLQVGCDHPQPDLPLQVEDGLWGLFDPQGHASSLEDGRGDLFFLWPEDDPLAAGDSRSLWLYLGGDPGPAVQSDLHASTTALSAGELGASFDPARGGLLSALRWRGGPAVIDQASAGAGNGAYIDDWSAVPSHGPGELAVLASGPLVAVVEASGERAGLAWTQTYALPSSGDELRLKIHLEAVDSLTLNHPGDWSNGVRPLQSRHPALEPAVGAVDAAAPDTVDLVGTGGAVLVTWRSAPAWRPYGAEVYDSNLILFGNDLTDASGGILNVAPGTALVDHRTLSLLPHDGDATALRASLPARLAGLSLQLGAVEQR